MQLKYKINNSHCLHNTIRTNKPNDMNEIILSKKNIPKNNKIFLRIICTQRTPIIELISARFREINRFYSPLKSDIKSALFSFNFLVVFNN